MKNQGYTLIELIVTIGVVLSFISIPLFPLIHFSSTREGKHTGYVTAIEQEGYFFPNYRVYFKTDNSSSQEDKYCLHRNKAELANKLKTVSVKRQLVTITFNGVRGIGPGLCNDIEITNVETDK